MTFEELIFASGWHEVKFKVHDFVFGLFINGDWRDLAKKGRFLEWELGRGLFFEEEFLHINESLLMFVVDQLEDFVAIALGKVVKILIGFCNVPE